MRYHVTSKTTREELKAMLETALAELQNLRHSDERVISSRKELMQRARQLARSGGVRYTEVRGGHIVVTRYDGTKYVVS